MAREFEKNNFMHVENSVVEKCNIMGVEIAAVNMSILMDIIHKEYKNQSGEYICVANVHTTVTAYDDPSYKKIQNNSFLTIPDGGPLSSYGSKHGYPQMARTFGPEFMEEVIKSIKGARHFFYGSTDEVLKKMIGNLLQKYPNTVIAGKYSPPFTKLTEKEDKRITEYINSTNPDFVWVGLGAPKQEIWMYEHKRRINGLMVGVGAAFAYHAGLIKRAPIWMQKCNLEWLYRLIQEPQRLFKRYLYTNTKFIIHMLFFNNTSP